MPTTEDVIKYLKDYDNPTREYLFDILMNGLDDFILPETNVYSLILLSKAREQGLDLVYVDREKFLNVSVMEFQPTLLETAPFEGARYVYFDLSPIMLNGYIFTCTDYVEGFGYGFVMDTINFVNEIINHYLEGTGRTSLGEWQDENLCTIGKLAPFINKLKNSPSPKVYKEPIWHYLLYPFIVLGFGIHYTIKYIGKAISYALRVFKN